MTGMTYARYLHLKELLSLQRPLTPPADEDVHDGERLFIVVHQASETLLSQALIDMGHIERGECTTSCFDHRADRATRLIEALENLLTLLHDTLDPEEFRSFRDSLGTASGLQSKQFHELFELTERLTTGNADQRVAVESHKLVRLRAAARRWRCTHLKLVEHMIGGRDGTGDTSGVDYLERRLNGSARADSVSGCPAMPTQGHS